MNVRAFFQRSRRSVLILAAASVLGVVGGFAARAYAQGDCCYPGAPCCKPGAACCNSHNAARKPS